MSRIILIVGGPGTGKSTLSRLVTERYERSVRHETDRVRESVVKGFEPPRLRYSPGLYSPGLYSPGKVEQFKLGHNASTFIATTGRSTSPRQKSSAPVRVRSMIPFSLVPSLLRSERIHSSRFRGTDETDSDDVNGLGDGGISVAMNPNEWHSKVAPHRHPSTGTGDGRSVGSWIRCSWRRSLLAALVP